MTQRLVIIGAGGFGREVLDVIEAINDQHLMAGGPAYDVLGFLADPPPDEGLLKPYGVGYLGSTDTLCDLPTDVGYVIGIGDPAVRRRIDDLGDGRPCPTLVHPSVTWGREVTIGAGSVVCAGVRLTNHIRLGRHVHLNLNTTIGHDATLEDYVTASPLVAVSGNVTAGAGAFLGTGATVNPGVTLGAGCVVGSGSVVLRDVEPGSQVVGIPARPR